MACVCVFKGYTQWKLEDNKGERPLRGLWHLPFDSGGACQHTGRRAEESGCLQSKGTDTCESLTQIPSFSPVQLMYLTTCGNMMWYSLRCCHGSIQRARRRWHAAVSPWSGWTGSAAKRMRNTSRRSWMLMLSLINSSFLMPGPASTLLPTRFGRS